MNSEDKIVEETKVKENKSQTVIIVILLLALIASGGYIAYKELFNSDTTDQTSNKQQEEKEKTEISQEISLTELENNAKIYDVIEKSIINNPMVAHNQTNEYKDYFYRQENLYANNMKREVLMSMATTYLGLEKGNPNTFRIDNNTFQQTYTKLFGDKVQYVAGDFKTGNFNYIYDKANEVYNASMGASGNVDISYRKNKPIKAYKTDDTIIIYDLVGFIVGGPSTEICRDFEMKKCIPLKDEDKNNITNNTIDLNKYKDNLDQYKYIFKLGSDNNYYFYGVKLIKQ